MQAIKTKASTTRPTAKARSRMDSRFMGLKMLFESVLSSNQLRVLNVATNLFVSSFKACKCNAFASYLDNTSSV